MTLSVRRYATKIGLDDAVGYDYDWYARYGEEVIAETALVYEVAALAEYAAMPPTQAHRMAVEYAEARARAILSVGGELSMADVTAARVQELVAKAIGNGDSMQTLAKTLRDDYAFSRSRAESIARTETATALGQGARGAAIAQGRDEKSWVTQGDSHVEEACLLNEAAGWIPIDDAFPSGVDTIPQHSRCRCNCRYRHKPVAGRESLATLAEVRCPQCTRLQGYDVSDGRFVCPRCKTEMQVQKGLLTQPKNGNIV